MFSSCINDFNSVLTRKLLFFLKKKKVSYLVLYVSNKCIK